ncbi:hypothetical protein MAP00_001731 [Monascus purpureus]|nr:hypothetical protein MAP00_001731 [Monascus purpureus]
MGEQAPLNVCRAGLKFNNAVSDLLPNVMVAYVNVFGSLGGELGFSHGVSTLIIDMKRYWWAFSWEHIKLVDEIPEPEGITAGFA